MYTPRPQVKGLNQEYWIPFLQAPLYKSLVAVEVANNRFEQYLKQGDTINHSHILMPGVEDYVPNTDITSFDLVTAQKEQLVVNRAKIVPFYVDRIEELQTNIALSLELGERASYKLRDVIDSEVLANTTNGNPYVFSAPLSDANIISFFVNARKELREANVEEDGDWVAVVDPATAAWIELRTTDRGFSVADSTLRNGFAGTFIGFKIYVSNNLPNGVPVGSKVLYIGKRGMIDLVMQSSPQMDITKAENRLGYKFKPYTLFGTKVFSENAKRFLAATVTHA